MSEETASPSANADSSTTCSTLHILLSRRTQGYNEDGHCQVPKHVVVPYAVYYLHISTNK